jgi:hypothetical protein
MLFTRGVPLTNFVIASSALCFQVFVLYPWHHQLDADFEDLKKEHLRLLYKGEVDRQRELKGIQEELANLQQRRAWF